MKTRIVVCGVMVLVLSMFLASASLAECPLGKTEVTIVAGKKIIEICVPYRAVDHIGGPNEIVIPATCPGYTQEEVEIEINNNENIICERNDGSTSITGDPCTYIVCYDKTTQFEYFGVIEGPEDMSVFGYCEFSNGGAKDNNICFNDVTNYWSFEISEEEADACAAILNTFVP